MEQQKNPTAAGTRPVGNSRRDVNYSMDSSNNRVTKNSRYSVIALRTQHCEKGLFVLASRQKIPVLRKENPAFSTRTIFLLPIEFFKITHARKTTAFYIPLPEKVMPENPSK
jgi:hypothetical protein